MFRAVIQRNYIRNLQMFSPPKHRIAILAAVTAAFLAADLSTVLAQANKRTNLLRQAKTRTLAKPEVTTSPEPVVETTETVFSPSSARPLADPPVYQPSAPVRQASAVRPPANAKRLPTDPRSASNSRNNMNSMRGVNPRRIQPMQASRVPSSYVPQHLRLSQYVSQESVVEDQAPIMSEQEMIIGDEVYMDSGCGNCGECLDCCGSSGGYFDACDPCFDRGGCDPCIIQNCWLRHLGPLFRNSEWGFGASASKFARFDLELPGDLPLDLGGKTVAIDDNSFGYYFEFNVGVPLCHLTCGLVSWQFGMRSVHSNFDGHPVSKTGREQTFVTTGFYRRVDYGLQFGCVADFLNQDWFLQTKVRQLRGDVAWVYPSGKMFGFRFAYNTKTDGEIYDIEFDVTDNISIESSVNENASTLNNYRFYYQYMAPCGGTAEYFAGWSDRHNGILGVNWDVPLKDFISVKTGFTYMKSDDDTINIDFGGDGQDSWNLYTGCVYRPRGRGWYRCYDKPLFNVADNGSMIQIRDVEILSAKIKP